MLCWDLSFSEGCAQTQHAPTGATVSGKLTDLHNPQKQRWWVAPRAGDGAWPTASWRPSAGCGSPIPSSAPGRCSPSCGRRSQTWERAPGRSARR
eukprot:scaffold118307_cov45-Phaeocystis_antarctica.AAC.1